MYKGFLITLLVVAAVPQSAWAEKNCSTLFLSAEAKTESRAIEIASEYFPDFEGTREFGRVVDSIVEHGALSPAYRTKYRIERFWRASRKPGWGEGPWRIAVLESFLSNWGFTPVQRTQNGEGLGAQLFGTTWVTWQDRFTGKIVEVPEGLATGQASPQMSEEMLRAFVGLLTDSKIIRIRLNQTIHGRYVKTSTDGDREIIIERIP